MKYVWAIRDAHTRKSYSKTARHIFYISLTETKQWCFKRHGLKEIMLWTKFLCFWLLLWCKCLRNWRSWVLKLLFWWYQAQKALLPPRQAQSHTVLRMQSQCLSLAIRKFIKNTLTIDLQLPTCNCTVTQFPCSSSSSEYSLRLILFSGHLAIDKVSALTKLKAGQMNGSNTNSSCKASHLK